MKKGYDFKIEVIIYILKFIIIFINLLNIIGFFKLLIYNHCLHLQFSYL